MAKQITVEMLRESEACGPQVGLFLSLFGDSVEVTEEAAVAVADRFDWDWAARHFLTAAAWDEFERVMARTFARLYREQEE